MRPEPKGRGEGANKRRPSAALFLSLIAPGLGQIYNGQPVKGTVFAALVILLPPAIALTGLHLSFHGLLISIVLTLSFYSVAACDSFMTAKHLGPRAKKYDRWYFYFVLAVLLAGANVWLSDTFRNKLLGVGAIYQSSANMETAVLPGDYLLLNLKHYRKNEPLRGEIIAVESPEPPGRLIIQRVIAVGGDVIGCVDKTVYLNGLPLAEPHVRHTENGRKPKGPSRRDDFGPLTVPGGRFFVMGDNRGQSYDSRFFGPVGKDKIIGKALYIYWSKNPSRIGTRFN